MRSLLSFFLALLPALSLCAESVNLTLGDSTVAIQSLRIKKQTFLNVADLARLPLSVRSDTSAGILVLCSQQNCQPVFMIDPEEYQTANSQGYVRAERIADALDCSIELKKNNATFTCQDNLTLLHAVGSDIGSFAPGFHLPARGDTGLSLAQLRASNSVVIAFIRSGEWDPFSRLLLLRLKSVHDSLSAAGVRVIAFHGYEQKFSGAWQDSLALPFPLVADESSAVMRGYDVFDRGTLPHPAIFLVDQQGVIRLRHVYENLDGPPDISSLMHAIIKTRN